MKFERWDSHCGGCSLCEVLPVFFPQWESEEGTSGFDGYGTENIDAVFIPLEFITEDYNSNGLISCQSTNNPRKSPNALVETMTMINTSGIPLIQPLLKQLLMYRNTTNAVNAPKATVAVGP